jgi:DNA-binding CsgD family transcriptional regulator
MPGGDVLEPLGFNPIEEHVYKLLVTRVRMSLTEIVGAAEGPAELQKDALDKLVAKGLVRRLTGTDNEYVVAPPDHAVEVLITERMSALQEVRAQAAEMAVQVRRAAYSTDPVELIEVVSGEGSVRSLFLQAMSSAREELAIFDCPPYATDADEAGAAQDDRLSKADGFRIRAVFDRSLLDDEFHARRILQGVTANEEEGRVATVPLKLLIVDREWAIVPLLHANEQTREAAVIVRRSVLLDSLLALFESVWLHAAELKATEVGTMAVQGTAERELREIAHLLNLGMTDVAISHHLGLSERTVRRRIKDLMDELKVDSRFRAGVRAAQRGWA